MKTSEQATTEHLVQRIAELECRLRDQQATSEALLEDQARYQALVNSSSSGIVTMTADGVISSFNRTAEHMFGYPAAAVIGKPTTMLMPEHLRTTHQAGVQHYLETGLGTMIGHTVEVVGLRCDGQEIPLTITITATGRYPDVVFLAVFQPIVMRE